MKGFIVVDRINDIQFLDTDKEFAKHINEQAKEAGLLPASIASKFYEHISFFLSLLLPGARFRALSAGVHCTTYEFAQFVCIKVLKFALLNLS